MQTLAVGSDKAYDSTLKLDGLLAGAARTIIGASSDTGQAAIVDGSDWGSIGSAPDAEIGFGGNGAASTGSSMLQMEFDTTGIGAGGTTAEDVQFIYVY